MTFFGRESEHRLLQEAYDAAESAFIPIYGRRRVGKSALILHAFEDVPHLYFTGKQAPAAMQRRAFLREAARTWDIPALDGPETADWNQAIDLVLAHAPKDRKLVLSLDEFQWMAEASPELPSILQEYWDREWQHSGKMVLILCGSYLGFMERDILGRKSPLFGRRTAQIGLQPFHFHETILFHPNWSLIDRARAYFICGGIPYYLNTFKRGRSIPENIREAFLGEHALLHYEADFLLREELRELEIYHAILTCLANGSHPNKDIANRAGIDPGRLTHYLNTLIQLGYVRKHYPSTGKPPAAKQVRFSLEAPLLRFWFHFIFPNHSYLAQTPTATAYRDLVQP